MLLPPRDAHGEINVTINVTNRRQITIITIFEVILLVGVLFAWRADHQRQVKAIEALEAVKDHLLIENRRLGALELFDSDPLDRQSGDEN